MSSYSEGSSSLPQHPSVVIFFLCSILKLPANAYLGRQQTRAPTLCPCPRVGDLDRVYGAWLWPGAALNVAGIWETVGLRMLFSFLQ